jgi:hypothetical protein
VAVVVAPTTSAAVAISAHARVRTLTSWSPRPRVAAHVREEGRPGGPPLGLALNSQSLVRSRRSGERSECARRAQYFMALRKNNPFGVPTPVMSS